MSRSEVYPSLSPYAVDTNTDNFCQGVCVCVCACVRVCVRACVCELVNDRNL